MDPSGRRAPLLWANTVLHGADHPRGSAREPFSSFSITSAIRESQPAAGGEELGAWGAGPQPGPGEYWTGEDEAGALGARERGAPFPSEEDQLPKVPCSVEAPAGPSTGEVAITSWRSKVQQALIPSAMRFAFSQWRFDGGPPPRWLQTLSKNGHARRGDLLPQSGKFDTKVCGPTQGILHSTHSNKSAAIPPITPRRLRGASVGASRYVLA